MKLNKYFIKKNFTLYFFLYFFCILAALLLINYVEPLNEAPNTIINMLSTLLLISSMNISDKNTQNMFNTFNYSRKSYIRTRFFLTIIISTAFCLNLLIFKTISVTLGSSFNQLNLITNNSIQLDFTFVILYLYCVCLLIFISSLLLFDSSRKKPLLILHYSKGTKEKIKALRIIFGNLLYIVIFIVFCLVFSGILNDLKHGPSLLFISVGIVIPLILSGIFYYFTYSNYKTKDVV